MKTVIFLFLTVLIILVINQPSYSLLQTAGVLTFELNLGQSDTKEWGLISEENIPVVLELRAEGIGSELIMLPETVDLGPGERVDVDVTVNIPQDYHLDNVELNPSIFALQRGQEGGATVINIQMHKPVVIKIGENPVPLPPEPQVTPAEPEKEMTLAPGEEKTVEVPKEPASPLQIESPAQEETEEGGGCLIATATYDSEMAGQVQMLREIRDAKLLATSSGSTFMTGFNQFYYTFSPTIADWERQSPVFKEAVKLVITPLLTSLSILNHVDLDSEAKVLGYGISVILLNVGMYFIAPAVIILKLKRNK